MVVEVSQDSGYFLGMALAWWGHGGTFWNDGDIL